MKVVTSFLPGVLLRTATATSDRDRHTGDRDKESCTPGQTDSLKSPCDSRTPGPATNRTDGLHHGFPSPHSGNACSTCGVTGAPQSSVPKSEAKSLQQLPGRELSSSSRSHHCLRSMTHSAGQSGPPINPVITFLQISDNQLGFDRPANPNVEYLATVRAVFAVCHRRVFRNALTLTAPRISSCATSNRPIQIMSGKQNNSGIFVPRVGFDERLRGPD